MFKKWNIYNVIEVPPNPHPQHLNHTPTNLILFPQSNLAPGADAYVSLVSLYIPKQNVKLFCMFFNLDKISYNVSFFPHSMLYLGDCSLQIEYTLSSLIFTAK